MDEKLEQLEHCMRERLARVRDDQETSRAVYEFGDLIAALKQIVTGPAAATGTRRKAKNLLAFLADRCAEQGPVFWQPTFTLNFVAEAMVRERFLNDAVIRFVSTGLYFYGLNWIERHQRHDSARFLALHGEVLVEFTGRTALKDLIREGTQRIEQGRPFCVVHHYVAALKRAVWAARRSSHDACDVALSLAQESFGEHEAQAEVAVASDEGTETIDPKDRVTLLMRVFAERLSPVQQRVYLARHRADACRQRLVAREVEVATAVDRLLEELEASEAEDRTWRAIAQSAGVTEKSAKREYLRALYTLLTESARLVLGETIRSSFVRRVMRTLQSVIQEKDLRIRDNTGRGLGRLVERWQVAMRFVLNHDHFEDEAIEIVDAPRRHGHG